MEKKVTMAAAIINRFGFSRSEAATFWDVREDTVKKWESGKMEMPTTLELTALEQIKDWQGYCERMAVAYNELFKDEPETFIGVPTPTEAKEYGIPESQGFIANTVAAICAELAYDNHQLVLLTSTEATDKNFYREAREAAFMWMFNFWELADMRASLSEVGLAVTDFAVTRLRKDLKSPIAATLSTTGKADRKWSIRFARAHDAALENADGETDSEADEHFEISFTPYELEKPFDFQYDDEARVRLAMENGQTLDAGLVTDSGASDFVALNAAVADMLNELFGTPAKMLAAFEAQRAVEQAQRNRLN
jgi:hypothetical protein